MLERHVGPLPRLFTSGDMNHELAAPTTPSDRDPFDLLTSPPKTSAICPIFLAFAYCKTAFEACCNSHLVPASTHVVPPFNMCLWPWCPHLFNESPTHFLNLGCLKLQVLKMPPCGKYCAIFVHATAIVRERKNSACNLSPTRLLLFHLHFE